MKIYVAHPNGFDFKKELYQPLDSISQSDPKIQFIFPYNENEPVSSKRIFHNKSCDLVIAEVSLSSTGLGIELGWADRYNIPIVCIFKTGSNLSRSLNIVSSHFIEYENSDDLIAKLKEALVSFEENEISN